MPLILKVKNGVWPRNGFPFTDPKTGKKFDGMSADLDLQTANVIKHRKANPTIYGTEQSFDAVRQEIVNFMCSLRPELCVDGIMRPQPLSAMVVPTAPAGKKCYKCGGTEFTAVICPTCGGSRIKGWKCKACGTQNPK